ncbi:hypothetical protein ACFQ51_01270 [Streptomyces kaempferi]|nr:hypothetical protein [Streptomyces sp. RPA4-2]QIY60770.1 hypothetical protein HEP85_02510 [Streptomyces sp. RPA4-2]
MITVHEVAGGIVIVAIGVRAGRRAPRGAPDRTGTGRGRHLTGEPTTARIASSAAGPGRGHRLGLLWAATACAGTDLDIQGRGPKHALADSPVKGVPLDLRPRNIVLHG